MNKMFSKKIILFAAVVSLFSVFIALSYNQVKEVRAQDEPEVPEHQITCGKEIPNGEAFDRTAALSYELSCAFNGFDAAVNRQIEAARQLVTLANQCNISRCQPVDCGSHQQCTEGRLCRNPLTQDCTSPLYPPPCQGETPSCLTVFLCEDENGRCDRPTLPPCNGRLQRCTTCTKDQKCDNPTMP
ncbi:MAG: hypothetical protein WC658_05420, partial [Candidatus Omnitrophota bacterium]